MLALNLDLFFFFSLNLDKLTFEEAPPGSLPSWPSEVFSTKGFRSVLLPGCITLLSGPLH